METEEQLITYQIDYVCPYCFSGKMRPTGIKLTVSPVLHEHRCNKCNRTKMFNVTYPYVRAS